MIAKQKIFSERSYTKSKFVGRDDRDRTTSENQKMPTIWSATRGGFVPSINWSEKKGSDMDGSLENPIIGTSIPARYGENSCDLTMLPDPETIPMKTMIISVKQREHSVCYKDCRQPYILILLLNQIEGRGKFEKWKILLITIYFSFQADFQNKFLIVKFSINLGISGPTFHIMSHPIEYTN